MVDSNYDYSKFGNQLHVGISTLHKDKIESLWHTDSEGKYWCGCWHHRTPKELLDECTSTIRDLLLNHPELLA